MEVTRARGTDLPPSAKTFDPFHTFLSLSSCAPLSRPHGEENHGTSTRKTREKKGHALALPPSPYRMPHLYPLPFDGVESCLVLTLGGVVELGVGLEAELVAAAVPANPNANAVVTRRVKGHLLLSRRPGGGMHA